MFNFLFRIIGLFVLALALVLAILDVTRSITAASIVMTPLAESWATVSPGSLVSAQQNVQGFLPPFVWDSIIMTILSLPSWLLFWLLAMLLLWLGQPRASLYGRFAAR